MRRYVVLTTKHHDGLHALAERPSLPEQAGLPYHARYRRRLNRRPSASKAMRMALYYSGGLDWAFNEARIEQVQDCLGAQSCRVLNLSSIPSLTGKS